MDVYVDIALNEEVVYAFDIFIFASVGSAEDGTWRCVLATGN